MLVTAAAVRPPTAAPLSGSRPTPHASRLAHWRAAAFSVFADEHAQGPFSLWPRPDAKAAVPKPAAPAKRKGKPATEEDLEGVEGQQLGKGNMRFRSALEQVSYITNDAAFKGRGM